MCFSCWEEAGKPHIDNPNVREATRLISELYEVHSAGGNLHIVVDDWNVENNHLDFCYDEILKDNELELEDRLLHLKVYNQLKLLTEDERISALALADGFWD